jgi:hypothetical protein
MVKLVTVEDVLNAIELEFLANYWKIRNERYTNWKAVNRTRVLGESLVLLGVPRWAIKEARYHLRQRVCKRCYGDDVRCYSFYRRMQRGDFEAQL